MSGRHGAVRWRDDTGWEARCPDCAKHRKGATFWPLTDEFWDRAQMARCRACQAVWRRKWEREAYAKRATRYNTRMAYAAEYRKDTREVRRVEGRAYYWANREAAIAKARRYYETHREEVLERRRATYRERKAA